MIQFLKAQTANFGESRLAREIGVEIIPVGKGLTWMSKDITTDEGLARAGWELARERIAGGEYDIVILDEITYCINFGWLDLADVLKTIAGRREGTHVIVTGRDAPEGLIAAADLVTEMREVKHPYKSGVKAQKGIEF
jgi:cob(I)alamin adenosyltransferase